MPNQIDEIERSRNARLTPDSVLQRAGLSRYWFFHVSWPSRLCFVI
jgi:hypothetical protein